VAIEGLDFDLSPGSVTVAGEWLVHSGSQMRATPLGGSAPELDTGTELPFGRGCGGFASATPDHWWSYDCSPGTSRIAEVSLIDHTPRAAFAIPPGAWPVGDTEAGLLVVAMGGGAYLADDAGAFRRIADGLASGRVGARLLVTSCDDRLECRHELLDPVTGDRVATDGRLVLAYGFIGREAASTPDGSVSVVFSYEPEGPVVLVIDATTGFVTAAPRSDGGDFDGAGAISPDGSWVFWSSNGLVYGWHVGDPDIVEFDLDGRTLVGGY
jgi:hypothetical protein